MPYRTHVTSDTDDAACVEFVPDEMEDRIQALWVHTAPGPDVSVTVYRDDRTGPDPDDAGALHVQIDSTETTGAMVVHLNDGPRLYTGDPEKDDAAVEALQKIRALLTEARENECDAVMLADIEDAMKGVRLD